MKTTRLFHLFAEDERITELPLTGTVRSCNVSHAAASFILRLV